MACVIWVVIYGNVALKCRYLPPGAPLLSDAELLESQAPAGESFGGATDSAYRNYPQRSTRGSMP